MRSFGRIAVMVVASLLTLTICGGGYTSGTAFGFVGFLLVAFWGLPILGLITVFHFLDKHFGPYARYPIALIGLFPLALVIYFGARGDQTYIRIIVLSGLAWSAAWLATSHIFSGVPDNLRASVLVLLLMLPLVIATFTGHVSLDRRLVEPNRPAPRDEPKVFGEVTGVKLLVCHDHKCFWQPLSPRK
jgi:hypothetical protein